MGRLIESGAKLRAALNRVLTVDLIYKWKKETNSKSIDSIILQPHTKALYSVRGCCKLYNGDANKEQFKHVVKNNAYAVTVVELE